MHRNFPRDVAERIAAFVVVCGGIRQLPDAEAVHYEHNRASEAG
jgi:hypothetical protein